MLMNKFWISVSLCGAAVLGNLAMAHPDAAHVDAQGAWARASVAGQQATGAFVRLTAREPLQLVGVETSAAAVGEIHEMTMDGDVMRMRAIDALALPKDQTVELKPGGYHIMFQQLKAPLEDGAEVPMTLVFKDAQGALSRLHLQVPVQRRAPQASHGHGAAMPAQHGH